MGNSASNQQKQSFEDLSIYRKKRRKSITSPLDISSNQLPLKSPSTTLEQPITANGQTLTSASSTAPTNILQNINNNNNNNNININNDIKGKQRNDLFTDADLTDNVCGSPLISSSIPSFSYQTANPTTPLLSSSFIPPSFEKSLATNVMPLVQASPDKRKSDTVHDDNMQDPSFQNVVDDDGHHRNDKENALGIIIEDPVTKSNLQLIPTILSWNTRANSVYVLGTFNEWKAKIPMKKGNDDFTCVLNLKPGTHRLKFLVDGEWKCSPDLDTALDASGNLVNYIDILSPNQSFHDDVDLIFSGAAKTPLQQQRLEQLQKEEETVDDDDEFSQEIPSYLMQNNVNESSVTSTTYPMNDPYLSSMNSLGLSNSYYGNSSSSSSSNNYAPAGRQLSLSSNYSIPPNPLSDPPPLLPPHLEKIVLNQQYQVQQQQQQHAHQQNRQVNDQIERNGGGGGGGGVGEEGVILPTPNHVCINHLYALSIRDGVMGLSSTRRFRNKYITTVFYRPVAR